MQAALLDPSDWFLISMETLIVIGLLVAVYISFMIKRKHPKITTGGWTSIIIAIALLVFHAVFDVLDTLQLEDIVVDTLNVFDGLTFVLGLLLFAYGIFQIAEFGMEQWEL